MTQERGGDDTPNEAGPQQRVPCLGRALGPGESCAKQARQRQGGQTGPGIADGSGGPGHTYPITEDSAMLSSASETTVWRAMASRVASCFFRRLFRL